MTKDEHYIKRCITLAKHGLGSSYPNPLVGSVIVYKNKIIGEGWHYQAGQPHAEVNAIRNVEDKSLLKEATIYVSLEPCSHFGKTPPCADLILDKGIKKVVIGTIDPFAKVSGNGIKKLIAAGCDVKVGVLEKECNNLNKRFFTYHTQKRPYIILKWAETLDGYIAPDKHSKRAPIWISNQQSRQLTHKWRAQEDAILVGNNTVVKDNPKLSIRNWHGTNPTRIIVDSSSKIPKDSHVLDRSIKTILISQENTKYKNSDHLINESIDIKNSTQKICDLLYQHQIQSVIIEGGLLTLQSFIDNNLWDEARVFTGNATFATGTKAPIHQGILISKLEIQSDTLNIYQND